MNSNLMLHRERIGHGLALPKLPELVESMAQQTRKGIQEVKEHAGEGEGGGEAAAQSLPPLRARAVEVCPISNQVQSITE